MPAIRRLVAVIVVVSAGALACRRAAPSRPIATTSPPAAAALVADPFVTTAVVVVADAAPGADEIHAGVVADAPPSAPAWTEVSIDEMGWPIDTASVVLRDTVHVKRGPSATATAAGKIVKGTRAGWQRIVVVSDSCPRWIELNPYGFVCADQVQPSKQAPNGVAQPPLRGAAVVPGTYFDVKATGTKTYASERAAEAGEFKEELPSTVMLHSRGAVEIAGVTYQYTNKGLVPTADLTPLSPSSFVGVDVRSSPPPAWPFGFVFAGKRGVAAKVRATSDHTSKAIGKRASRSVVGFGTQVDGMVEIEPGVWAARDDLRRVAITTPPAGVGVDDRWIDVDLDEQVLVAYRGATPEFATLVSSGRVAGATPIGVYQVRAMAATTRMGSEVTEAKQYDVAEVPWAMRFRRGLFLHAAYWHDGFGGRKSHGCVNLAPRDAHFLFDWAALVPAGWSEVEVARGVGVVVRIRDAANPDPPRYDYLDEPAD
jgi:lipoprotein-anchoring transpeptidase ErfK/SrfK